jgi:hypothetical protein
MHWALFTIIANAAAAIVKQQMENDAAPALSKRNQVIADTMAAATTIAADTLGPTAAAALPGAIGKLVDAGVEIANLAGIFRHKPTPN